MRILIVEEALEKGSGHWPNYIGGLAAGMRQYGDTVDILGHENATETLRNELGVIPYLSQNCWLDSASQGLTRGLRHSFKFKSELKRWLKKDPHYSWVFSLTVRLQHLLAFALLSRSPLANKNTKYLLLFVQGFSCYSEQSRSYQFLRSPSNVLAKLCFRLLTPAVKAKNVILAAETEGMKRELEEFTQLPVELFPHPIEAKNLSQNTNVPSDPITVSCPGFARHEKGSDLLISAIERLKNEGTLKQFHFILQWPEPFQLPDGTMLEPGEEKVNSDHITFYNGSLDAAAYNTWLSQTDFVILPYRKSSYYNRLSRVAIEAGACGIPLIYTDGTWTEEVAALVECGVKIDEESPAELVKALNRAYRDAENLKGRAVAGSERVKQYHSCEKFRSIMLQHLSPD